ncbi:MAG: glycerophosphodiester phosphodiesterase [Atopostipes suicloacalis]|nr:glycerophosphodiester phosphodiesterase [Atopostipes suicloacalis]
MKRFLRIFAILLTFLLLIWGIIYIKPVEKRPDRTFYREDDPDFLVIAHRGGRGLAPEGTMAAFDTSAALGVDIFEYDIHQTVDGHLVVSHDPTVDRMTNGSGRINDLTLKEVQALDAGYHFKDEEGNYKYRGQGVFIPTVREVFEAYPKMRQLIENKDTNREELYEEIIQKLWLLIEEYEMEEEVMIGSFDHDINERFEEVTEGEIPIGAGEQAVREFANLHVPYLNGLAESTVDSLQLPVEQEGQDLASKNIIASVKKRNMAIYYWTINEKEEMRELIAKDVDGIITDYPDRLKEVIEEFEDKRKDEQDGRL